MDAELKSLLTVLIDKVERIEATMATKDDIARLEREQATTRQVFSSNHFTLTGRVDQLTLQYETLVGVRASAAE